MMIIRTSASTSNLGPGFDCLGLALNIYNFFEVELSDKDILLNIDDAYNNEDNLFLKAYRKGLAYLGLNDHIKISFNCDVPVARGLGSSSTLIVGGLTAASALHNHALSKQKIFELASEMEGHPDNSAPCVFGGFCASFIDRNGQFITRRLSFSDKLKMIVFIPDFEVKTETARAILPNSYSKKIAVNNSAKAIMAVNALENGDLGLLRECAIDEIHEPYRRTLIDEFDSLKEIYTNETDGVLLISGSGSTCIGFSDKNISENAINKINELKRNWLIRNVEVDSKGVDVINE